MPPTIVSSKLTPQGIALTFSKPMDPAGASNVNNYRCGTWDLGTSPLKCSRSRPHSMTPRPTRSPSSSQGSIPCLERHELRIADCWWPKESAERRPTPCRRGRAPDQRGHDAGKVFPAGRTASCDHVRTAACPAPVATPQDGDGGHGQVTRAELARVAPPRGVVDDRDVVPCRRRPSEETRVAPALLAGGQVFLVDHWYEASTRNFQNGVCGILMGRGSSGPRPEHRPTAFLMPSPRIPRATILPSGPTSTNAGIARIPKVPGIGPWIPPPRKA